MVEMTPEIKVAQLASSDPLCGVPKKTFVIWQLAQTGLWCKDGWGLYNSLGAFRDLPDAGVAFVVGGCSQRLGV